jgi:hypothetical protein
VAQHAAADRLARKFWVLIVKRKRDMKTLFSANKYGSLALALAAFAVAGTAPVFAESSGAWSAGISGEWSVVRAYGVD